RIRLWIEEKSANFYHNDRWRYWYEVFLQFGVHPSLPDIRSQDRQGFCDIVANCIFILFCV
ncbi:MAG: hypothetical protein K2Q22_17350, partial [Cytophagales bacterium]|nr:hypothetical protein [Cytophagales bacterium]